jgi:hypothetical protein
MQHMEIPSTPIISETHQNFEFSDYLIQTPQPSTFVNYQESNNDQISLPPVNALVKRIENPVESSSIQTHTIEIQASELNSKIVIQPVYTDITHLLNKPQSTAALAIGMKSSTFSKRWREARPKEHWPYRSKTNF